MGLKGEWGNCGFSSNCWAKKKWLRCSQVTTTTRSPPLQRGSSWLCVRVHWWGKRPVWSQKWVGFPLEIKPANGECFLIFARNIPSLDFAWLWKMDEHGPLIIDPSIGMVILAVLVYRRVSSHDDWDAQSQNDRAIAVTQEHWDGRS